MACQTAWFSPLEHRSARGEGRGVERSDHLSALMFRVLKRTNAARAYPPPLTPPRKREGNHVGSAVRCTQSTKARDRNDVAVTLRPATPEDRFRIRRWLAEPEVGAGWGNAGSAEAEINLAMGSEAAICRIIECEGAADRLCACPGDRPAGRRAAGGSGCRHLARQCADRIRSRIEAAAWKARRSPCSPRRCLRPRWPWGARAPCRSGTRLACGPTSRRAFAGSGSRTTGCSALPG